MIRDAIAKVVEGRNLDGDEAAGVMREIMTGGASGSQIGAFLTAMCMKGETAGEIASFASVMRETGVHVRPKVGGMLVDTCGTGGDMSGTFNISTAAAFAAAGAGVPVVKHGNRSASGRCGSADVLEALGADIDLSPDTVGRLVEKIGIGFFFARTCHPAMKYAAGPRSEIGIRTVFNILGPLANPAGADAQLLGVYGEELVDKMAEVLLRLGTKRAMVVYGDGLDEITTSGVTTVAELRDGGIERYEIDCRDFGIPAVASGDLGGGDAATNAYIIRGILSGKDDPGRGIVLMNAAAAIYVGGYARSLERGLSAAERSIDGGRALAKLDALTGFKEVCSYA